MKAPVYTPPIGAQPQNALTKCGLKDDDHARADVRWAHRDSGWRRHLASLFESAARPVLADAEGLARGTQPARKHSCDAIVPKAEGLKNSSEITSAVGPRARRLAWPRRRPAHARRRSCPE